MARVLATIMLCLLGVLAFGHDPNVSSLRFILRKGDATVSVTTHRSQLRGQSLAALLRVSINGEIWTPAQPHLIEDPAQDTVMLQAEVPVAVQTIAVTDPLFPQEGQSRLFVSVFDEGRVVGEGVVATGLPTWRYGEVAHQPRRQGVFGAFVRMGGEHILFGIDHLLFLVGLILIGGRLKSVLTIVTAFTVAHAITLSLSVLGYVHVNSRIVEPLIALSIVAVAIEAVRTRSGKRDVRVPLAFCFGLAHGFGFAGALAETGVPAGSVGVALAGFNIGVEVVQAILILSCMPLLRLLNNRAGLAMRLAPGALGCAGAVWFVQRLLATYS